MKLKEIIIILKRLYREHIKKYFKKILLALVLSLVVAGSTSTTAWLLDPAVKKIFIDQDQTLAWIIVKHEAANTPVIIRKSPFNV